MGSGETWNGRDARIGPYRIVTTLGAGGMGQVLKVQDTRTGQLRALKIPLEPPGDRKIFLSYRREHRAMSRCDHPNIARAFDYGIHAGYPYLVMELVAGVALTDFIDQHDLYPGPKRDRIAALFGIQIASALAHLHERGVIHRDLKPDNVLVTQDEVVKLVDFGIAQELEPGTTAISVDMAGTYAYCSPEQFSEIPLDHRSDLYSLGVVLYLLLTDDLPIVSDTAVGYAVKHLTQAPVPPEKFYPAIPAQLRDIILKLLEKSPQDRPRDGYEVEEALRAFVEARAQRRRTSRVVQADQGVRLLEPAFLGHRAERAELEGAISLLQAGAGGAILLLGETGLDKARIIDEAVIDARARGLSGFSARCLAHAEEPYQAVLELVEALVAALPPDQTNLVQAMLGPHLPVLARYFPAVTRLLPPDTPSALAAEARLEQDRLQSALLAFLQIAPTGPTVLALKDLHRADDGTLSLLSAVLAAPASSFSVPVLWLASASTDALGEGHPLRAWMLHPPPRLEQRVVHPLEVPEVQALVDSMLGVPIELGELALELYRESHGNPLYVAEAVRAMAERGHLQHRPDDEGWVLSLPGERPHNLAEMLAERLTSLPPLAVDLLERMALLGRPCGFDWLLRVTGLDEEKLLDVLEDLLSRRILIERAGKRQNIFYFAHPRTADVLKSRIDASRLPTLHVQLAGSWLQVHGDGGVACEVAGSHYYQAGQWAQAASALAKAAEERLRIELYAASRKLLEQALDCCRQAPHIDLRLATALELQLGRVLERLEDMTGAATHLEAAYFASERHNFTDLQQRALFQLGRLSARLGDYASSSKQFAGALRLQRAAHDQTGLLFSMNGLAESLYYLGDFARARRLFEECAAGVGRREDDVLQSRAAHGLGLMTLIDGRFAEGAKLFAEAARRSRAAGRDTYHLLCQALEAEAQRLCGDFQGVRTLIAGAVEGLQRVGEPERLAFALCVQASLMLDLRDLERAERLLQRAGEVLTSAPQRYLSPARLLICAQLELARGKTADALDRLATALEAADAAGYLELTVRARRLLAAAHLRAGRPAEGLAIARRSITEAEELGHRPGSVEARLVYAEALVLQGARAEADQALEQAADLCCELGMRLHLVRALALRGRLAQDAGQKVRAELDFKKAWENAAEIRMALSQEECATFDRRPEVLVIENRWKALPRLEA